MEQFLADKHKLMVEALRKREEGILQYVILLGGALSGFAWIVKEICYQTCICQEILYIGTLAILLLLTIGSIYASASSFNYRAFLLQIAILEKFARLEYWMLTAWAPDDIINFDLKWKKFHPEVIKVFWWSFQFVFMGVFISFIILLPKCNIETGLCCFYLLSFIVVSVFFITINLVITHRYLRNYNKIRKNESNKERAYNN